MKHTSIRNPLLLFLTAVIWGIAFVAQSVGMEYVGPFTFNCVRCILGAVVLVPCIAFLDRLKEKEGHAGQGAAEANMTDAAGGAVRGWEPAEKWQRPAESRRKPAENWQESAESWQKPAESQQGSAETQQRSAESQQGSAETRQRSVEKKRAERRTLLAGGICCGIALCVASNLQQFGIQYTTVGKAGFITAMYIVLVPILGIFLKKRIGLKVAVSVALAVAGLYLLCITEGFSVGAGDLLVLLCALVFAVHILVIDYFSPRTDGVRMSCIQFLVCGLLSGVGMVLTETPDLGAICQAWLPIAYAGVMSCGVAYTLQIVGQKGTDPTVASLILSLESVVSVLAGWVILGQSLSMREIAGCALMFAAIILAQLPGRVQGENA